MKKLWMSFLQWAWRYLYTKAYHTSGVSSHEWVTHGAKVVCIDLDDVIAKQTISLDNAGSWETYYARKVPMPGAHQALTNLINDGWLVIIFTSRMAPVDGKVTRNWLQYYSIPYSHLVFNKPFACVYIDDKALKFWGDWSDMLLELEDPPWPSIRPYEVDQIGQ